MSRPRCPRHGVPLHDDGRCRACWEHETGRCASHGYRRGACPQCLATTRDGIARRQQRLREMLGLGAAP